MLGVQGCGKSLCAKAVSTQWQLPLLRFDMGRMFGSLVGSSEENVRRAIAVAESIAPAILWVDEIDKAFAGSQGSGATDGGKGRLDEIFFVDLPAKEERGEIFRIHLAKRGRDAALFDLAACAVASPDFSGAEIEEAINSALYDAFYGHQEVTTEHILHALAQTVPLAKTMDEQISRLRAWAEGRARNASTPPDALKTAAGRHMEL